MAIIPCSRVGHVFRTKNPFKPTMNMLIRNIKRGMITWVDEKYHKFYYAAEFTSRGRNIDHGDLSVRLHIKNELKCKSFDWYLKNVYPNQFVPKEYSLAYGRIFRDQAKVRKLRNSRT